MCRCVALIACLGLATASLAQEDQQPPTPLEKPLSVIDWLGAQPDTDWPAAPATDDEPAVANTGAAPAVSVAILGAGSPRVIGLVPSAITGLPETLWAGSDVQQITTLIETLPDLTLPAAQALLFTVLLTEAKAPGGAATAGDALALARVAKLMAVGALDPALSLVDQAGVVTSPAHFDLFMQISLLTGTEGRACAVLAAAPHLNRDYGVRIFCDARAGNWRDAALTLGAAQALTLMPANRLDLLDRFLNPDVFEDAAPLPLPARMDPLSFRLFESIGEPASTRTLARAYAVADLRDLAGWKAQLEAAERLTRAGALPDNRLLGLYSERSPAASGGVWDRVAALQRFETALSTGSADAIAKTLPRAWAQMRSAGLEVPFSNLFAEQVAAQSLSGRAAALARDMTLLSPGYESSRAPGAPSDLLAEIAQGDVQMPRPQAAQAAAVHAAFTDAAPVARLISMARDNRLGESILELLRLLQDGAVGDPSALRDALATLRAIGLEDTARRAALQILILENGT